MIIKKDYLIAAVLAFFMFALCYRYNVPEVCGVYHDDAIYISTAKAIANGDGYKLINLPNSPKQTKYPILYPLLLALIWKIWPSFPENIFYMQIATSLLGSFAIGICYLYFVRFNFFSRFIAFNSCLLCLTVPEFLYFSTNTLSEIPFLFIVIISLWCIDNYIEKSLSSRRWDFIIGIVLSLPFLCRSIGIVFTFAGLSLLIHKKRPIRWVFTGITVSLLPWMIWISSSYGDLRNNPVNGYYTDYLGWWLETGPSFLINIIFKNLLQLLIGSVSLSADGLLSMIGNNATHFVYLALIILGLLPWISMILKKDKPRIVKYFLFFYFLIICVWPWPPYRFLIPILPFIISFFMAGSNDFLEKLIPSGIAKFIIFSVSFLLIITNSSSVYHHIVIRHLFHFPLRSSTDSVNWNSYENLFKWIKLNSTSEEIMAHGLDTMTYLYTNRAAVRPFFSRPISLFYGDDYPATGKIKDLKGILKHYKPKYLIQTPMPRFSEEKPFNLLLDNLIADCPTCLHPVYVGIDSRFKIYKINYERILSEMDIPF